MRTRILTSRRDGIAWFYSHAMKRLTFWVPDLHEGVNNTAFYNLTTYIQKHLRKMYGLTPSRPILTTPHQLNDTIYPIITCHTYTQYLGKIDYI